jgi:hypothetical protein
VYKTHLLSIHLRKPSANPSHALRKPADFLPLRIIQNGGIGFVIIPDVEGKSTVKAGVPPACPDPQDFIRLQRPAQGAGLVPCLRDKPPASEIHRCITEVLNTTYSAGLSTAIIRMEPPLVAVTVALARIGGAVAVARGMDVPVAVGTF